MPSNMKMLFVKAQSIADLCRLVCTFDQASVLFFYKGKNALVALGERIGKIQLAYLAEAKKQGTIINYSLPASQRGESVEFANRVEYPSQNMDNCNINVLDIDFGSIPETDKISQKEVKSLKFGTLLDLAKALIRKSAKDEALPYLYSFELNGKNVFGSFDAIDELADDAPLFYYTEAQDDKSKTFLRYDYKEDKIEFTNSVDEHAYLYIKIIRLAEPFGFLAKPNESRKSKSKEPAS